MDFQWILNKIVDQYRKILGENLSGIYLHGSMAMGCFHPETSDIDLLVAVKHQPDFAQMRALAEVLLKSEAPGKGFEMSVILEQEAKHFKYPTPFVLHYSDSYKDRYREDPSYLCLGGEDPDLAAHFTVTRSRGSCLFGEPISQVFGEVPAQYYLASVMGDIENAGEDILHQPVYHILNLCRTLCYLKEGAILSKSEGGEWAQTNLEEKEADIAGKALQAYADGSQLQVGNEDLACFAEKMLDDIRALVAQNSVGNTP